MNETTLIEKLIKIEALFAGAATDGERASADQARQRILKRLQELLLQDPPVEYKFTFSDMWSRKVRFNPLSLLPSAIHHSNGESTQAFFGWNTLAGISKD